MDPTKPLQPTTTSSTISYPHLPPPGSPMTAAEPAPNPILSDPPLATPLPPPFRAIASPLQPINIAAPSSPSTISLTPATKSRSSSITISSHTQPHTPPHPHPSLNHGHHGHNPHTHSHRPSLTTSPVPVAVPATIASPVIRSSSSNSISNTTTNATTSSTTTNSQKNPNVHIRCGTTECSCWLGVSGGGSLGRKRLLHRTLTLVFILMILSTCVYLYMLAKSPQYSKRLKTGKSGTDSVGAVVGGVAGVVGNVVGGVGGNGNPINNGVDQIDIQGAMGVVDVDVNIEQPKPINGGGDIVDVVRVGGNGNGAVNGNVAAGGKGVDVNNNKKPVDSNGKIPPLGSSKPVSSMEVPLMSQPFFENVDASFKWRCNSTDREQIESGQAHRMCNPRVRVTINGMNPCIPEGSEDVLVEAPRVPVSYVKNRNWGGQECTGNQTIYDMLKMEHLDFTDPSLHDPCSHPDPTTRPPLKIPKIVHFIFGLKPDFGGHTFLFAHFMAIKMARDVIKPEVMYVHYYYEPKGYWWDRVKKGLGKVVVMRKIPRIPDEIFGNKVEDYAHRADVLRLQLLLTYGGIYLDSDVFIYRSLDPLLHHDFVMAKEDSHGMANAFILAHPRSKFLHEWYGRYRNFDDKVWSDHSVLLPLHMAKEMPSTICVMPRTSVFYPSFWDHHVEYGYHSFNHIAFKYMAKTSPNYVRNHNSSFTRLLRPFLDDTIVGDDTGYTPKVKTNASTVSSGTAGGAKVGGGNGDGQAKVGGGAAAVKGNNVKAKVKAVKPAAGKWFNWIENMGSAGNHLMLRDIDLANIGMNVDGTSSIRTTRALDRTLTTSCSSKDHLAISPYGINVSFLHEFIKSCGGRDQLSHLTTAEISETIIKPLTSSTNLSLCDTLLTFNRHDAIQIADVFISHAWSYKFIDMIDAIDDYITENEKSPHDVYIWLDLVSNPQHGAEDRPFEWWKTTFINAIRDIKEVVLVLQPWDDPIPLRRAWCIYEIFACHLTEGTLNVAMSPKETERMLDALSEDNADGYNHMLARVSCEKSETSIVTDRDRIFKAIRELSSMENLDRLVFDVFTKSIVNKFNRQLDISKRNGIESDIIRHQLSMAQILSHLSSSTEAEVLCLDAVERCERLYGPEDHITLDAKHTLVTIYTDIKQTKQSFEMATSLLTTFERIYGQNHHKTLDLLVKVGSLSTKLSHSDISILNHQDTLDKVTKLLGPENIVTISATENLVLLYYSMGRFQDCIDIGARLVEIQRRVYGEFHVHTLKFMEYLYMFNTRLGNLDKAEQLVKECYLKRKTLLGEKHLNTIITHLNWACMIDRRGRRDEAIQYYIEVIQDLKTTQGSKHVATINAISSLSTAYFTTGNWKRGLEVNTECLEICTEVFGSTKGMTVDILGKQLRQVVHLGYFDMAEKLTDIDRIQTTLGLQHQHCHFVQILVASVHIKLGKYELAKEMLEPALDQTKTKLGDLHPDYLAGLTDLVKLYIAMGDYSNAEQVSISLVKNMVEKIGLHHPRTLSAQLDLCEIYIKTRRLEQAKTILDDSLPILERDLGSDHPLSLTCLCHLGSYYQQIGNLAQSKSIYQSCFIQRQGKLGDLHPDTLVTLMRLGSVYRELGDFKKAKGMVGDCNECLKHVLGMEHPLVFDAGLELGRCSKVMGELDDVGFLKCLEGCLVGRRKVLGEKHPDTVEVSREVEMLKGGLRGGVVLEV
ncbi:hypothetical protein HDU76_012856 [Blyttiomyces sp. JEL0837]|nr:hypothetical protein HDU76_012856 [Blyttiomyces sp. JEL0837]